ncbi:MAG: lactate utilization protein [Candidatus Gracilibacteria bacterium]
MQKIIKNLEKNGFQVIHVATAKEACEEAKKILKNAQSIGLGGSETVKEIGLLDWMRQEKTFHLFDQYEPGISMEENKERRRQGMLADVFVASSNALSESGFLINVDGSGNRTAAFSYGPKKVLLIVGKNKIVKGTEQGFKRINKIAAPKNVERLNQKALLHNKPPKYTIKNIQNVFSVIKKSDEKNRIIIILVEESLGY